MRVPPLKRFKFILSMCSEKSLKVLLVALFLFHDLESTDSLSTREWGPTSGEPFDKRAYLSGFKVSNSLTNEILSDLSAVYDLTRGSDWLKALRALERESTLGKNIVEFCHLFLKISGQPDERFLEYMARSSQVGRLPEPLVKGGDLVELGFSGRSVGEMLDWIYREQLTHQGLSKEDLLERAMRNSGF